MDFVLALHQQAAGDYTISWRERKGPVKSDDNVTEAFD
jgi:hypothetical protein